MTFTYEQMIWLPILLAVIGAGGIYLLVEYILSRCWPLDDE